MNKSQRLKFILATIFARDHTQMRRAQYIRMWIYMYEYIDGIVNKHELINWWSNWMVTLYLTLVVNHKYHIFIRKELTHIDS